MLSLARCLMTKVGTSTTLNPWYFFNRPVSRLVDKLNDFCDWGSVRLTERPTWY